MNIFISWSGETSKEIAEILRNWLPAVIQSLKPFYSSHDIAKGKRWSYEISNQLNSTDFGIILLTRENVTSPWLLFEAGALSKNISSGRVCTMLFDLKDTDVQDPLDQFQNTKFNKKDIYKLISDINNLLGKKSVDSAVLLRTFEKMWIDLENDINLSLNKSNSLVIKKELRSERELIEEVLRIVRRNTYKYLEFDEVDFISLEEIRVKYNSKNKEILFYSKNENVYKIYLSQLTTSSKILDFILQINSKGWCKPKHISDFINCLEELCEEVFNTNAQEVLSPFGNSMHINWDKKRFNPI